MQRSNEKREPGLVRSSGSQSPETEAFEISLDYFLETDFKAVHATLGMTGACPSIDLIFAVCIKAFTATTSKVPSY